MSLRSIVLTIDFSPSICPTSIIIHQGRAEGCIASRMRKGFSAIDCCGVEFAQQKTTLVDVLLNPRPPVVHTVLQMLLDFEHFQLCDVSQAFLAANFMTFPSGIRQYMYSRSNIEHQYVKPKQHHGMKYRHSDNGGLQQYAFSDVSCACVLIVFNSVTAFACFNAPGCIFLIKN